MASSRPHPAFLQFDKFGDVSSNMTTKFNGTGSGLDLLYAFNYQWNMKMGVAVLNTNNVGSHASGSFTLTHIW